MLGPKLDSPIFKHSLQQSKLLSYMSSFSYLLKSLTRLGRSWNINLAKVISGCSWKKLVLIVNHHRELEAQNPNLTNARNTRERDQNGLKYLKKGSMGLPGFCEASGLHPAPVGIFLTAF